MDHPLRPAAPLRLGTWRSVAVVASAVAALELILLVTAGVALLTRDDSPATAKPKRHASAQASTHAKKQQPAAASHERTAMPATLPRTKVGVVVLNGNGRPGAAAAAASRVHRHGYRIRSVGNAPRMSYTRSLVMYRPGYEGEGTRFAQDLGIRLIGPLDGMRPAQLHGAQVVLILGP